MVRCLMDARYVDWYELRAKAELSCQTATADWNIERSYIIQSRTGCEEKARVPVEEDVKWRLNRLIIS